jgi:16S rRNA (cytidine1402-2'-O)-methyltransferase
MGIADDQAKINTRVNGILYVVATPIGNLADITFRAIETLNDVALIAAEDTRHTQRLLAHYDIRKRMVSFHEHNENRRTPELIERLQAGISIALVSNAGTPTLSDPGYRLIKTAAASNIRIVPIPGPSAALASLSASGLPTDAYVFLGFLPRKEGKRNKILKVLSAERKTLIFYESPRRILDLLSSIIKTLGDRQGVLSREMTKRHEEFVRGALSEISYTLRTRSEIKGECTLVVQGNTGQKRTDMGALRKDILEELRRGGTSLSNLSKHIADRHGLPKKKVYSEALKLKSSHHGEKE